jgi:hypothetical protein
LVGGTDTRREKEKEHRQKDRKKDVALRERCQIEWDKARRVRDI